MENQARLKTLHYRQGATKRKLNITRQDKVEPGDLIKRANEMKRDSPKNKVAIMGLV